MMDGVDLRKPRRRQFIVMGSSSQRAKLCPSALGSNRSRLVGKSRGPLVREGSWGVNRG